MRLEKAQQFLGEVRVAAQDAGAGLRDHATDQRQHLLEVPREGEDQQQRRLRGDAPDSGADLSHHALGLARGRARDRQQAPVAAHHLLARVTHTAARRPSDLQHPARRRSAPVTHLAPHDAGRGLDALHRSGQHPHAVGQEARVGRIVDVRLRDRRVDPRRVPTDDTLLARHLHDSSVDRLHALGTDHAREADERLGVGNPLEVHPRQEPIDQARAHLALGVGKAPPLEPLEHEHPQRDLSRCPRPPSLAAPGPPPRQALDNRLQKGLVIEHLVEPLELGIDKPRDELLDRAEEHLEELALLVASGDHRRRLRPRPKARALASAISIPSSR